LLLLPRPTRPAPATEPAGEARGARSSRRMS